ncbi:ATP-binding protein [Mucilaginibacter sp.]|uniref:sensor histidine kinase n=1 Tax=Mucilaginibacter sp. TaxID=1882438 RepID=UPI00262D9A03|nr:ATP-binding protein [Mucilaginibacter sp.]
MKIKNRLSLYFTFIGSGVLLVVMITLYLSVYAIVHSHFYTQLKDRANIAAQLYLEADEITPDSLSKIRNRFLKNLPGEVIRLYDSRNSAAFISDKQQYWDNKIIDAVRKHKYLQYSNKNYQVVGIYYKDNQGNFVILVSAEDTLGKHELSSILQTMIILFLIVAVILFLISQWLAKNTLSPIKNVVNQMQLIKSTNLHLRVNEGHGNDEISELAHNFNRLLEHLENAFEMQKTYVTNASHELRTPITSIIGEVELALSKERSAIENKKTLQLVLEESERLRDTITGLMELAQVDMDYTIAQQSPVRIDELLWEIQEYWANKAGAGILKINIEHMPEDESMLTIPANYQLLFIALNNLIGNAFKFSDRKTVLCNFYADKLLIRIQIIDSGIGIPHDDMELVFKSFYRGNNSRSFAGNGIGLYVTQKIIQLFNGTLTIESVENKGTSITVNFNRSN